MGPKKVWSSILTLEQEAAVVAFRRHTLLPLDDCLYALEPSLPYLTRSSLHRCLQCHGISRLPNVEGDKPGKRKLKVYPNGFFHIDIAEVRTEEGNLLFVHCHRPNLKVRYRAPGGNRRPTERSGVPGCRDDDGRISLTDNAAERALRGIALCRRPWMFAGSDHGGERAADVYTLIIIAKLNGVDPRAWLADVPRRIAD